MMFSDPTMFADAGFERLTCHPVSGPLAKQHDLRLRGGVKAAPFEIHAASKWRDGADLKSRVCDLAEQDAVASSTDTELGSAGENHGDI